MRSIKRMLALVLVLAMSFALVTTSAIAADGLTISVGSAAAKAGETVTVPVTISNNPGILAAKLSISFNHEVLELTEMTNGTVFTGNDTSAELNKTVYKDGALIPNECAAVFEKSLSDEGVSGNGTLLTLTFKIKEGATAGDYPVNVTVTQIVDSAETNITATAENGKVTVNAAGPSISDVVTDKLPATLPAENISFSGNTMTVTPAETTPACVVLIKDAEGNYTKVPAVKNDDGTYSFDVANLNGGEIVVAVKGDVNGDGKVNITDRVAVAKAALSGNSTNKVDLDAFGNMTADVNGDGKINITDRVAVAKAALSASSSNHQDLTW